MIYKDDNGNRYIVIAESIEDVTRQGNRVTIYKNDNGVALCMDRDQFISKYTKIHQEVNELELKKITATLLGLKELRGNHMAATAERSMYNYICDTLLSLQELLTKNTSDEELH